MVNIALFGTSADPPTCAHQAILQWLSHHYDQVVVWASDNPFKSHQTTLEQRSHMLKLLIEEIDPYQNPIRVSPDLSSPRTVESIALAKQRWGLQANLTLVIGTDLVRQMPRWYQIEQLLKQVQLLVIPRSGYGVDQASLEKLKHLGAQLAITNITVPSVSSTAYRENGDTTALTPLVKDYIHQEQLYQ